MLKVIDAQDLQDPEKVLTIWIENLKSIVNRINSIISSTTGMTIFAI